MIRSKPKLIVILGPTSSGKSALAISLAKKFNGEIISADSRQVYKGMDIGTGKVPISYGLRSKTSTKSNIPAKAGIYSGGIRHHLIDIVSPKKIFTVAQFKDLTQQAITKITNKQKVPFLVGGTPFYIYAVIDNFILPEVKPNFKLRKNLSKKSASELFALLKKLDPRRASLIDKHNKVRLIRAIEINTQTGFPVPSLDRSQQYKTLLLGLNPQDLKKRIADRVNKRFKQGLIREVKHLIKSGISIKRLKQIGLTYALIAEHVKNVRLARRSFSKRGSDKNVTLKKVIYTEQRFARRQMTWFKTDKRINWIKNQKQAEKLIKKFIL